MHQGPTLPKAAIHAHFRRRSVSCLSVPLLAAIVFLPASPAPADFITFDFDAVITAVGQVNSFGGTNIGDTFSGSYTFDSAIAGGSPYNFSGGAPIGLTAQIGTETVILDTFTIGVANDAGFPSFDQYQVIGNTGSATSDTFFDFTLQDSTASVFSDASLPLTPPAVSSFDIFAGNVRKNNPTTTNPFSAFRVTSITLQVVPEPGTLALLALGIVGLATTARRMS